MQVETHSLSLASKLAALLKCTRCDACFFQMWMTSYAPETASKHAERSTTTTVVIVDKLPETTNTQKVRLKVKITMHLLVNGHYVPHFNFL